MSIRSLISMFTPPSDMAYAGGELRRTNSDFNPRPMGPNNDAYRTLPLLRRRVRSLIDDNPIIEGAKNVIRNNSIGTGIKPFGDTEWPDLNERINDILSHWSEGVDPDRCLSLAESQAAFIEEVFGGGEVLVRHVIAAAHRGFADGPAIELIDAERMPITFSRTLEGGNPVRQGVEFNAEGQRVAFWILPAHPNDTDSMAAAMLPMVRGDYIRVPASQADLAFRQRRRGQIRGVPWPVAVVEATYTEQQFLEAYLMLARVAACVGAWIEGIGGAPTTTSKAGTTPTDVHGNTLERLEPGMLGRLPHGAKINLQAPNIPPPSIQYTEAILLRKIAAGLGISASALSRDYTRTTFSAARVESLEDRRAYRPIQRFVVNRHTTGAVRRRIAWAITSGELTMTAEQRAAWMMDKSRVLRFGYIMPGWEWVNPAQEAAAAKIELEIGITSPQRLAAAKGDDWQEVMRQRLEAEQLEQKERERLGLPEATAPSPTTVLEVPAEDPDAPLEPMPNTDDEPESRIAHLMSEVK